MTRSPHEIQHGDRWANRHNRPVVVASNDWPPPRPGSHEGDLYRDGKIDHWHDEIDNGDEGWTDEQNAEFSRARRWSLKGQGW